jgi:urease accessory protein
MPPVGIIIVVVLIFLVSLTPSALAHHALGGKTPNNVFEGFLSGLAHPLIGLDHFAFVVASGLLAVGLSSGLCLSVAFVISTVIGTGIHLQSIDLPLAEVVIAVSVISIGVLLINKKPDQSSSSLKLGSLVMFAIVAGIFHGYAYGESIIGAEMTPLAAYLAGFTVIQLAIAYSCFLLGQWIVNKLTPKVLTLGGWVIGAIGFVFLTSAIL